MQYKTILIFERLPLNELQFEIQEHPIHFWNTEICCIPLRSDIQYFNFVLICERSSFQKKDSIVEISWKRCMFMIFHDGCLRMSHTFNSYENTFFFSLISWMTNQKSCQVIEIMSNVNRNFESCRINYSSQTNFYKKLFREHESEKK